MPGSKVAAGEGRDKIIVMPFRHEIGQSESDGRGLGIHFFLGNLFCLHPGFLECWFGWRVKNIFPDTGALAAYCFGNKPYPDIQALGEREKVRFWVEGCYGEGADGNIPIRTVIHDTRDHMAVENDFSLTFSDGLKGFRGAFFNWLDDTGLGYGGRDAGGWDEPMSPEGMDQLGHGLLCLYRSYVNKDVATIDLTSFHRAVELSPDSYLIQNLLGWGRYKNGDFAGAKSAFLKARELNPHGMGALSGLMWLAVNGKDRERALEFALEKGQCRGDDPEKARAFVAKKFD
ncbi:MAG TPA: hypothetical protein DHV36_06350 [Desulfobacteraceae bacterium]|nr:hypothetical protein [Desulfobacteraceae bacterium]